MLALALASLALAGEAGGAASFNLRFGTSTCDGQPVADCRWIDLQDLVVVDGHYRDALSDKVRFKIAGRLRLHPRIAALEVGDTELGDRVQPYTLELPEAWIALSEVLVPALELRVGQQRFAWGTGLGMNPVDVLNPYDLRDPTRFDQRMGIPAVTAIARHKQLAVELVYLPLWRPARMPVEIGLLDDAEDLFDFSDVGGGDVTIDSLETRTDMPDLRIGFQGLAARASLATPWVDLAVMGYHGTDSLPQVGGQARLLGIASGNRVDVGVPIRYPRHTIIGLEARAPLFWDIGSWVEGAVVLPERVVVTATRSQLEALVDLGILDEVPDPLPETVIQDGLPFGRWVVGLDRFFGPVALSAQWIHGLPTERSRADVRDYAALGAQVTIADPVQLRGTGITDLQGWLASLHLDVLHGDAATFTLGATWAGGPDGSTLGRLSGVSHVALGVQVAF